MSKIKHLHVPKPSKGRRFAISDVHGCVKSLESLIKQVRLTKDDHLYLLGDMVNRGPSSDKVLDLILSLTSDGYQVFYIRGNHEQIILNASKKSPAQRKRVLSAYHSEPLLDNLNIREAYLKLLKKSYHYLDLGDYYLVHAGFDFKSEFPFENKRQMLNIRNFKAKSKFLNGRKIVVGHTPKKLSKIISRLQKNKNKLYIDNGCVNTNLSEQGNLVCLNLDTHALSIQRNLDQLSLDSL